MFTNHDQACLKLAKHFQGCYSDTYKTSFKFQLFFHFYKSDLKFRWELRKKLDAEFQKPHTKSEPSVTCIWCHIIDNKWPFKLTEKYFKIVGFWIEGQSKHFCLYKVALYKGEFLKHFCTEDSFVFIALSLYPEWTLLESHFPKWIFPNHGLDRVW